MQTAFLCYVQPLNNGIYTAYKYILRLTLSVTPIRIVSVNKKKLRNLCEFNKLQYLHLFTEKYIGTTSIRPFGEVGGKFPLQLSSQTLVAKIGDKKLLLKLVLKT